MVRQALMARRALLLLDGIDEGGVARERIMKHVTEVLEPQGHMIVLTSRPNEGLKGAAFEAYHKMHLCPLSEDEQGKIIESYLEGSSNEAAERLKSWIRSNIPLKPRQKSRTVRSSASHPTH